MRFHSQECTFISLLLKLFCHLVANIMNSVCHVLCSSVLLSACLSVCFVYLSVWLFLQAYAYQNGPILYLIHLCLLLLNDTFALLRFTCTCNCQYLYRKYGSKCAVELNWIEFTAWKSFSFLHLRLMLPLFCLYY